MKQILYNVKQFTFIVSSIIFFTSCKKFVEIDPPKNQVISTIIYTNAEMATSAIRGIYSEMINSANFASGSIQSVTFLSGFTSDDFKNYSTNINQLAFSNNNILADNPILRPGLWQSVYKYVYYCNLVLENLSNSTSLSSDVKNQLTGEAKFVRAFCYFYLVNLFGDVPLILSTDYRVNAIASRTPESQVYQKIISDLKDAETLLSNNYVTTERVRPNRWAASALLARLYLFTNDWANAVGQATSIINNSSQYSLVNDLNNVFLKNSNEAIWQLKPVGLSFNTNEGSNFILIAPPTGPALSSELLNSFETGDLRRSRWVGVFTQGVNSWYFPYKYKIKSGNSPFNEYSMVLRVAEQFLIRAEARAQLNDIPGAQADVNVIRNRSGLGNTPANDKPSLLSAIEQERRVELFAEWGHRWIDLKRWNRLDAVIGPIKSPNWQSYDKLYPIPLAELNSNPNLTQNPGY